MTHEEIDTMWQQAMQDSIKDGDMFTRYHFAKLVAEKAAAKERESYFHTLGPNEMLLRLVREHNGEFCHYAYKFNADLVINILDLPSMVAAKAELMSSKIEAAIKAKGKT
jgi:hypothetical protein